MTKYKAILAIFIVPILLTGCSDNSETVKAEYVTVGEDGVRSVSLESESIPLTYTPDVSKTPVVKLSVEELVKDSQWIDEVVGDGASQQPHLPDPHGTTNNFSDGNYHYFSTSTQCSLSAGVIDINVSSAGGDIDLSKKAMKELGIVGVDTPSSVSIVSTNGSIDFMVSDLKDANLNGWVAWRAISIKNSNNSFPVMFVKLTCNDIESVSSVNQDDILKMITVELG